MAVKEYEKLLAFALTLGAVCWLAWMASGEQGFVMVDGKPVSIQSGSGLRDVLIGMVAVLSAGAQALFRASETANAMNDLLQSAVDKLGKSVPAPDPDATTTTTTTTTKPGAVTDSPSDVAGAADQVADAAQDKADEIGAQVDESKTAPGGNPATT